MLELNKVYNCDCLDGMANLPNGCIDMVITSPPYDNLRDYKGYSFSFEAVANELTRVLKPGGVIVWVVGDATINGSETGTSFRQALYFRDECKLNLETMIYEKAGPAYPANAKSVRYSQVFEYMFVLSKGIPVTHNLIKDRKNRWAGVTNFGRASSRLKDGSLKIGDKIQANEYGYRFNIWRVVNGYGYGSKDKIAYSHPAIFPESLAMDHIITWSNPGEIVLDPFMGSGTTAKMALLSGRKFIGFEISSEYCGIINTRLTENFGPAEWIKNGNFD